MLKSYSADLSEHCECDGSAMNLLAATFAATDQGMDEARTCTNTPPLHQQCERHLKQKKQNFYPGTLAYTVKTTKRLQTITIIK